MIRPGIAVAAAVVLALVLIALIPIQRTRPDFRARRGTAASPSSAATTAGQPFRQLRWSELAPAGWDANKQLDQMHQGIGNLSDADPRAIELLQRMRTIWKDAPVNADLEGAAVRIPGYVVPLDESRRGLADFLLVPYFGACIHTPPPPANQIIHVTLDRPEPGVRAMDAVWVSGHISVRYSDSSVGASGYAMRAAAVERYDAPSH